MSEIVEIPTQGKDVLRGKLNRRTDNAVILKLDDLLIIMLHGFPGDRTCHGNVFDELSFLLRDKLFHTLAIDYTGCGESDGQSEDFTLSRARHDLNATIAWAKDQGYERFMFVGEGLGAVLPLTDHNDIASCFVLLWPILDLKVAARTLFQSDEIDDQWKKAGYFVQGRKRINMSLVYELEKGDISGALKKVNKPMIVMHGAQDEIAPIDRLDLLREHTQSRRIEITSFQDGEHGLPKVNHRKAIYYHIMQFIEKYS